MIWSEDLLTDDLISLGVVAIIIPFYPLDNALVAFVVYGNSGAVDDDILFFLVIISRGCIKEPVIVAISLVTGQAKKHALVLAHHFTANVAMLGLLVHTTLSLAAVSDAMDGRW